MDWHSDFTKFHFGRVPAPDPGRWGSLRHSPRLPSRLGRGDWGEDISSLFPRRLWLLALDLDALASRVGAFCTERSQSCCCRNETLTPTMISHMFITIASEIIQS